MKKPLLQAERIGVTPHVTCKCEHNIISPTATCPRCRRSFIIEPSKLKIVIIDYLRNLKLSGRKRTELIDILFPDDVPEYKKSRLPSGSTLFKETPRERALKNLG